MPPITRTLDNSNFSLGPLEVRVIGIILYFFNFFFFFLAGGGGGGGGGVERMESNTPFLISRKLVPNLQRYSSFIGDFNGLIDRQLWNLQSRTKITWTTTKNGVVSDTRSNVQPNFKKTLWAKIREIRESFCS